MFNRLVFWEPRPSPHKFPMFEALAELLPNFEIVCHADGDMDSKRRSLGWSYNDPEKFSLYIGITDYILAEERAKMGATIHIFSGIRHYQNLEKGLKICIDNGGVFCIMSEPRVYKGLKGFLRLIQSIVLEGPIRRGCAAVYAIGRHGPTWFDRALYPTSLIVPFAYFVSPPPISEDPVERSANNRKPVVGYLGRLAPEKGFNLFLQLAHNAPEATFRVAGAGVMSDAAKKAAKTHPDFSFCGAISIGSVGDFLRSIDVLVVPSVTMDDGWGVVVSEALMVGTTLIVSPEVGASACVRPGAGIVMARPDSSALDDAYQIWLRELFPSTDQNRDQIAQNAKAHLSAEAGAKLLCRSLLNIIERHELARAIW